MSAIQEQRDAILSAIKSITRGDWKVLVIDEDSKKIIDNAVKEDDILNENIANIERIEERRDMNPEMDAIYLISPRPHIVDCLLADFERRRYKKCFLLWTALLPTQLRRRIDSSRQAQEQIAGFETLSIDYFPRESHLITFRDPWSFPILYHPACNGLVKDHLQVIAQRITGICVALNEYPRVRYYKPRNPIHEASVLCTHLARFVQEELDAYAQWNQNFPTPVSRPQGILVITDRSMDLMAPLVHDFTYQAMANDLLPIEKPDKTTYKTLLNAGEQNEEEKEMEINENDKIWLEYRHRQMEEVSVKIGEDFRKFMADNPHFADENQQGTSLNAIKDMLAGLPQFQELKSLYSLHMSMAQSCMTIFGDHKLLDLAFVEQCLATGLDIDYKPAKNMAEEVIPLLDSPVIRPSDRLRLILLYIIFREGLIQQDIDRLLAHADLPQREMVVIENLNLLGAKTMKALGEAKLNRESLFPKKIPKIIPADMVQYARFETNMKLMLDDLTKGTLDQATFPYTRPPLDNSEELALQSQASLRSAKPTWARNRMSTVESRQRIIVFMAGGATYSEARACYEISDSKGKDVFLATSHMQTPGTFLTQVSELTADRRRLHLPVDQPQPKAPAYLFKANDPPPPRPMAPPGGRQGLGVPPGGGRLPTSPGAPAPPGKSSGFNNPYDRQSPQPPTAGLGAMSMNSGHGKPISLNSTNGDSHSLEKKDKEKKKRGFFGSKKH